MKVTSRDKPLGSADNIDGYEDFQSYKPLGSADNITGYEDFRETTLVCPAEFITNARLEHVYLGRLTKRLNVSL